MEENGSSSPSPKLPPIVKRERSRSLIKRKRRSHDSEEPRQRSKSQESDRGRRSRSPIKRERRSHDSEEPLQRSKSQYSDRERKSTADCCVYVANIPYEAKWTDIKDLFREKVGDVAHVELLNDESGKFRGCGVVELKDAKTAEKAIDVLHRFEYKGRNLVVKKKTRMEENGSSSPSPKSPPKVKRDRSRSPIKRERRSHDSEEPRQRSKSQDSDNGGRSTADCRVYVANIPYDTKWTDIKDLFRDKVGDVAYVELFNDESGKFRGCGIVKLKDAKTAEKAIDVLHRFEYKGRSLVVKEDFEANRDKHGRILSSKGSSNASSTKKKGGGSSGGGGSANMPSYNTYGLSPQFLESLKIHGQLTCKCFVANMDYTVTPKKMEEIFQIAGKVIDAELQTDKEGKSKGYGTVTFQHPVEAVQAISMLHGQKLFGRKLAVRMYQPRKEDEKVVSALPSGLSGIGKGLVARTSFPDNPRRCSCLVNNGSHDCASQRMILSIIKMILRH